MGKRSSWPQSRHHLLIYDEDWDFISQCYGEKSESKLGVNNAIKAILHSRVMQMRSKLAEQASQATVNSAGEAKPRNREEPIIND